MTVLLFLEENRTIPPPKRTKTENDSSDKMPTKGHGHYGLRNLGNTCYMNSALQCLSNVEPLTDYFLACKKCPGDVSRAYCDFIRNIWKYNQSYSPESIKKNISLYAPEFGGFDQQDAHEFMMLLLNQLHQEFIEEEELPTSIISSLFTGQLASITTCLICKVARKTCNSSYFIPLSLSKEKKKRVFEINFNSSHLTVNTDSNGFIEDLVQAFLNELQKTTNNFTDNLREHLKVLSSSTGEELSFHTSLNDVLDKELTVIEEEQVLRGPKIETVHKSNLLNLIDCFNEFIALETPTNLWMCKAKCQKRVNCAKRMVLATLPRVLLIQLKRFTERSDYMQKINTFVDFPLNNLDLSKFTTDQQNALYDLIAVINHSGNVNYGHYTAYARQLNSASNQWFCFNDACVMPINETDIVSNNAYILAYAKRES